MSAAGDALSPRAASPAVTSPGRGTAMLEQVPRCPAGLLPWGMPPLGPREHKEPPPARPGEMPGTGGRGSLHSRPAGSGAAAGKNYGALDDGSGVCSTTPGSVSDQGSMKADYSYGTL
jgi:hypothetical protein